MSGAKRQAVPEGLPVQEHWARTVLPGGGAIEFKSGRDIIIVLRSGVPRKGTDVKKGICCVYFVKGNKHFLAMVSEKKLNKMEFTLGSGRDRMPATNHALTLRHGMEAAAKKMGWSTFETVQACFGFWFDVSKEDGVVYKFTSCANYFNQGISTRTLVKSEEERLLAALDTVYAIPKTKVERKASGGASTIDSVKCPKKPRSAVQKKPKKAVAKKPEQQTKHKKVKTAVAKNAVC